MIVRTYGRRNRGLARTYSDSMDDSPPEDSFRDSFSLSQENPCQDLYSLPFSSQESSSLWPSFDPDPYSLNSSQENDFGVTRKSKKPRNGKVERATSRNCGSGSLVPFTSTLMEAQEFGEMMEHVDEVNFALDGLKKGQPVRIRRASLLSLLLICGTAHQRRLLRAQGLAKTIIDAILGLTFDDLSSNLAASTLFYVLTGDGQDENVLESSGCIHFLMKLLKPVHSSAAEDKTRNIGSKLLAMRKDSGILRDANKPVDSNATAIVAKVQEILVSCKDLNSLVVNDSGMQRPEISPKWIALLTMEKACLSKISFEDTSGIVRKTGGNFKEKFRELGGLDAVFEVVMSCHSVMESCRENNSPTIQERGSDSLLQSLVLLMKCLKIMENATFLSKDNQDHLLELIGKFDSYGSRISFTKLILSIIKILSGLYLRKNPQASHSSGKACSISDSGVHSSSNLDRIDDDEIVYISSSSTGKPCNVSNSKVDDNEIIYIGSSSCCGSEESSMKSQKSIFQFDFPASSSETTASQLRLRVNSSTSSSCSGSSQTTNSGRFLGSNGLRTKFELPDKTKCKKISEFEALEDSMDPFAFVEEDIQPSKWDLLYGKKKKSRSRSRGVNVTSRQVEDLYQFQPGSQEKSSENEINQQKSTNTERQTSQQASGLSAAEEEQNGLLADCLLTAVKVLMNLTNDNPMGCEQIAACGGLETMASLIACHFPSFGSPSSYSNARKEEISGIESETLKDNHLTDQELDFLVAILGLLVNLVEKDGRNRSRLAATTVSLPKSEESGQDVIPLLCSVFLANQGAGDATGDGNAIEWNDEAALLQGEKEAEKMIVEAYAALLLAFLSTESKGIRDSIAHWLPKRSLAVLVPVLERFVAFHLTLNMISPETHKAVTEVIESCRIP